jgi:hypothetical protein
MELNWSSRKAIQRYCNCKNLTPNKAGLIERSLSISKLFLGVVYLFFLLPYKLRQRRARNEIGLLEANIKVGDIWYQDVPSRRSKVS